MTYQEELKQLHEQDPKKLKWLLVDISKQFETYETGPINRATFDFLIGYCSARDLDKAYYEAKEHASGVSWEVAKNCAYYARNEDPIDAIACFEAAATALATELLIQHLS